MRKMDPNYITLSKYRIEKAERDLKAAKRNFDADDYYTSNNRSYYSIFHSLRAVLILDGYDSKKHSGIISEFRRRYIKEDVFPVEISDAITQGYKLRQDADYDDEVVPEREEARELIEKAAYVLHEVTDYLQANGIFE